MPAGVVLSIALCAVGCGASAERRISDPPPPPSGGDVPASPAGQPDLPGASGAPVPFGVPAPVPLDVDSVYDVELRGQAGPPSAYAAFAVSAQAHVIRTIDPGGAAANGVNLVDVGIFSIAATTAGVPGALSFTTNLSFVAPWDPSPASPTDVSFVEVDVPAGRVEATLDSGAVRASAGRAGEANTYAVASRGAAQHQHVIAGTVTLQFADGGQSITGTIQLGGSSGGSPASSRYSATLAGVLRSQR